MVLLSKSTPNNSNVTSLFRLLLIRVISQLVVYADCMLQRGHTQAIPLLCFFSELDFIWNLLIFKRVNKGVNCKQKKTVCTTITFITSITTITTTTTTTSDLHLFVKHRTERRN